MGTNIIEKGARMNREKFFAIGVLCLLVLLGGAANAGTKTAAVTDRKSVV